MMGSRPQTSVCAVVVLAVLLIAAAALVHAEPRVHQIPRLESMPRIDVAIGAFTSQEEITNLLFPGNQGSDSTSRDLKTNASVFRFRRDVGSASSIGALVTDRRGCAYANSVAGIDGDIRFGPEDRLRVQVVGSASVR